MRIVHGPEGAPGKTYLPVLRSESPAATPLPRCRYLIRWAYRVGMFTHAIRSSSVRSIQWSVLHAAFSVARVDEVNGINRGSLGPHGCSGVQWDAFPCLPAAGVGRVVSVGCSRASLEPGCSGPVVKLQPLIDNSHCKGLPFTLAANVGPALEAAHEIQDAFRSCRAGWCLAIDDTE